MKDDSGSGQQRNWLGADELEPKDRYVAVFIPSLTRDGRSLDHKYWRDEAVRTMSSIFGGATTVEGFGGWLDEEMGGQVKTEDISMIVSFFARDEWNEENVLRLRKFLHRMGREAEQGEIGLLVQGQFWRIRRYDHEE